MFTLPTHPIPHGSFPLPDVPDRHVGSIGADLRFVEGAVHWALYDLHEGQIYRVDAASARILVDLHALDAPLDEKRSVVREDLPAIWTLMTSIGAVDRLFIPDADDVLHCDPMMLWLEITDVCNERCLHCYGASGPERTTSMSVELASRVLREARGLRFGTVQIVGGEPFTHRALWTIVDDAIALHFTTVEIYTNLLLASPQDLQRVRERGISIGTSLLGPSADIHDACTGVPGSFATWLRRMKMIQELGITYRIGVIRMRRNEESMGDIEAFLRREGLLQPDDSFSFDDVRPAGRCTSEIVPITPSMSAPSFTASRPFFAAAQRSNPCWSGEIAIATDGQAYPCVFSRSMPLGSVIDESLADILTRAERSYWSITLSHVETCRDCEYRLACDDCRSLSVNSGAGLFGRSTRCSYNPFA